MISTKYDPGCSYSNSLFSISSCHFLCHLPICSLVSLVVVDWIGLTSFSTYKLLLPFSLPTFDVNGQTSLIVVLVCDLLYSCLINSSFVLILHVPSLSFVGPKIFLNTFLSNTINLFFIVSFKTHTSRAYLSYNTRVEFQF